MGKVSTNGSAAARLLGWYDANARRLAWRAAPGERQDPYRVWLSEVMLQQTTVAAVAPYYERFLVRWPSVEELAAAPLDEVLAAWAGLGYYARARNLHAAAQAIARDFAGEFPTDFAQLRTLPGVGDYTAGAIAAIAFDRPAVAVDANAERVLARYFALDDPLPQAKLQLKTLALTLLPKERPGDFAQALMDLGALLCTPKAPNCTACPWHSDCRARMLGVAANLPRKAQKMERPLKRGAAFVASDSSGAVLLEKRPESGLLGGMLQPPLGPWNAEFPSADESIRQAPFRSAWRKRPGIVRHVFTHFALELEVYGTRVTRRPQHPGQWLTPDAFARAALPTVMKKVLAHAGIAAGDSS